MTSNITAISSAPPPLVNTEIRAKDALRWNQQAQSANDSPAQPRLPSVATPDLLAAKAPAPGSVALDVGAQDTKAQDAKRLAGVVDELNQHLKGLARTSLQFNMDDASGKMVVKVMDVEKDELIRQIPPDELLKLAAFIKEKIEKEAAKMEQAALTTNKPTSDASTLEGLLLRIQV